METSDSDDEEGNSATQRRSQTDRLAREEAFFRFVNNLNEEEYKLMRDNNLLGVVGEYTEEELLTKLQHVKENPLQESGTRGSSDVVYDDSNIDCPASCDQTENMTEREQRPNQSLPSTSNSDSSDFSVGTNSTQDSGRQNQRNEHSSFARILQSENMENIQRQVENPQSISTIREPSISEESAREILLAIPFTRCNRRSRSGSPEYRRVRTRTGSIYHSHSINEMLLRFHYSISPESFDYIEVNETNEYSEVNQHETSRQQISTHELQTSGLSTASETTNASPDTTCNRESDASRQRNQIRLPDLEITVYSEEYSQTDIIARRNLSTTETQNNATMLESYPPELLSRFSYFQHASVTSSVSTTTTSTRRVSNTGLNNTTVTATERTVEQTVSISDELHNVIDNESDVETISLPQSQNRESVESQNAIDGSDGSSISVRTSTTISVSHSVSSTISSSNSNNRSSFSSSSISSSSSENENAEIASLILESNNERSTSSSSSSQPIQRQRTISGTSDENDPWPFLAQFFPLNEEDINQPTGLNKQQIDNLAIRIFSTNDAKKACSICITEFTEGSKIRILPCSHEYHVHCIDRWLADSTTCPICRRELIGYHD